ncbi:hypothetical protein BCY86_08455 [Pajaroellobacter abortibovis]|uniref:Uncharacterized protein n=1 Tax=Pajaroellobacter abortibovis TaxID=1882918 RepID=A0A1L6MZ86_9BACT|nr:hypothetical protein BCY86_08455 [Pajaroellobacter abortibovis]
MVGAENRIRVGAQVDPETSCCLACESVVLMNIPEEKENFDLLKSLKTRWYYSISIAYRTL